MAEMFLQLSLICCFIGAISTDMMILMILVIVLAVFLFFAVLVSVCACHWNRKRQEKSRPVSSIDAPIISNMDADGSHSSMTSWYPLYRNGTGKSH